MNNEQSNTHLNSFIANPAYIRKNWRIFLNKTIAREISLMTKYFDHCVQISPRAEDSGILFKNIVCEKKTIQSDIHTSDILNDYKVAILLNGNLNYHSDIQNLLDQMKNKMNRFSRLIVVAYNPYLRGLYSLANILGFRQGAIPTTFLTATGVKNLCKLTGFECVRIKPSCYSPFELFGFGTLINKLCKILPLVKNFSLTHILVLKPPTSEIKFPKLSVVIPARNEKGNIENALLRMPKFQGPTEIIFVEGGSNDGTWDEIQRVKKVYQDKFEIKSFKQSGKGKNNAVRIGFEHSTGEVLTILDADLTMPPEMLTRFYDAYCTGKADFINGTRLTYPMAGEAMRFLNLLGNIFFAKALSYVLDVKIGDSLCGTKLLNKRDYQRIVKWRNDFGDFDPFGDFELLFPASVLAIGIVDIPIKYGAREYGSTNINRFSHGFLLLKMTIIGLFRIKLK
jgi:hypothetical protein